MAQMSRGLAQSILDGSGITRGEVMQLCHHYLRTTFAPPEPRPDQGGNYVITSQGYQWSKGK